MSKIVAKNAYAQGARVQKRLNSQAAHGQRGLSLLELMVGIAIGLLVVAVAMSALMVSRGVSGTVSDASTIQQQAAYAMRSIGMQLRQSGSLFLNFSPNPGGVAAIDAYLTPVAFETKAESAGPGSNAFDPTTDSIGSTGGALNIGYRRYTEPVFTNATAISLVRNCLGVPADSSADMRVESVFQLVGTDLRCAGNNATAQPIVQNVANFQVRYLVQTGAGTGVPRIQYTAAVAAADWSRVQGVEVCLVLYGNEAIDLPAGSAYTDCDGTTSVDLTTLTGARARRMHMVFRNVYQLRSQGLI